MPVVLERRKEDVDLRWWRGWRCLGERERWWRRLGVEEGYGRRGEREGEVDMGRRWRARWRPGERVWWWRGLGVVDEYGRRGERGARRGVWGAAPPGATTTPRDPAPVAPAPPGTTTSATAAPCPPPPPPTAQARPAPPAPATTTPAPPDAARHATAAPRPPPERREWVVEARWECGRRGRVCRAGGERERRRLRDRPSSLELGQSGGVGGPWGASRGAAWYWGGRGRSPVVHGSAT